MGWDQCTLEEHLVRLYSKGRTCGKECLVVPVDRYGTSPASVPYIIPPRGNIRESMPPITLKWYAGVVFPHGRRWIKARRLG